MDIARFGDFTWAYKQRRHFHLTKHKDVSRKVAVQNHLIWALTVRKVTCHTPTLNLLTRVGLYQEFQWS